MSSQTTKSAISNATDEAALRALYQQIIAGWNIDLRKCGELWEDFYDSLTARSRAEEPADDT